MVTKCQNVEPIVFYGMTTSRNVKPGVFDQYTVKNHCGKTLMCFRPRHRAETHSAVASWRYGLEQLHQHVP